VGRSEWFDEKPAALNGLDSRKTGYWQADVNIEVKPDMQISPARDAQRPKCFVTQKSPLKRQTLFDGQGCTILQETESFRLQVLKPNL
jgi:hypothetical protein